MDGNTAVNFLEELEGSLKAVGPGALTERFAEGWTDAFPTTHSSSAVLLCLPEFRPPPEMEESWLVDAASEETVCC